MESDVHHLIMKPDVTDTFVHLSIHPSHYTLLVKSSQCKKVHKLIRNFNEIAQRVKQEFPA